MKFKDHKTTRLQDYETTKWSRGHVVVWSQGQAFTLVEMLVTLVLLSLIVLALMAVFNSTQKAFRASLTETDILESGRMAMGLMAGDLETMTPASDAVNTNNFYFNFYDPYVNDRYNLNNNVNFYSAWANNFTAPPPLLQSLTASPTDAQRTNILENFFSLSRQNIGGSPTWVGSGYAVAATTPPPDTNSIYPLYRFYMTTNGNANPALLFNTFALNQFTNTAVWSHLMDGVVDLTVTPYDASGLAMTNTPWYSYDNFGQPVTNFYQNSAFFQQSIPGVRNFYMYGNTVPASVGVEMGVLEDTVLQRAEGMSGAAQMNYLSNHVGQVHLFRQRVWIRNVDPAAYQ